MQLAFYKGTGTFYDKLIRLVTFSKYSHCELVINGVSYSSSPRDGGVRLKIIPFDDQWDIIEIVGDGVKAINFFNKNVGKKYDLWGAVKTVIPFVQNNSDKWFCSELIAAMLDLPKPRKWKPSDLYRYYHHD